MPWVENRFIYSKRILQAIAESYTKLYDGLPVRFGQAIVNPWALAEYKADFDMALSHLGRHWDGRPSDFINYRHYSYHQQIIIANILGIDEDTLNGLGFYNVPKLKDFAYFLMIRFLNEGK